ncbi:MAG: glycosyltransferase [Bacteroidota bacterium]|jgi:glycosyltransferase involved in cell wall biosynthesis
MKITFACYQSISIIHGGPRVQMLKTKAELEKLGVSVSLFQPWEPFDRTAADLVHLFSANLGTFHLAGVFQQYRIPFVTSSIFFTRHSPGFIRSTLQVNRFLKNMRSGIWTNYEYTRQICEWSRSVLPNTGDEGKLLERGMSIPREKIHTVPNGVDQRFEFGDPSLFKKKYGLDHFVLSVGHIGPDRKNALRLIKALQHIDAPAVLIGQVVDSPAARECVDEIKRSKNILLIEGLDNDSEMLSSAYAAADVFALPSLFETPGIAALEAGLAGANIVITPVGGTKEYFGDHAEYVDPYSIESIRNGIETMLNRKKSNALQKKIREEYLWKRVAEKTLEVYKSALQ